MCSVLELFLNSYVLLQFSTLTVDAHRPNNFLTTVRLAYYDLI